MMIILVNGVYYMDLDTTLEYIHLKNISIDLFMQEIVQIQLWILKYQ